MLYSGGIAGRHATPLGDIQTLPGYPYPYPGSAVVNHTIPRGIAGRTVPGQVQRDAIFSISERLHKRIASLRFGWNTDAEEKRLLLLRSKRREKRYDCTLRLRFCDPLLPARFEEERLLDAEIAAENQR